MYAKIKLHFKIERNIQNQKIINSKFKIQINNDVAEFLLRKL